MRYGTVLGIAGVALGVAGGVAGQATSWLEIPHPRLGMTARTVIPSEARNLQGGAKQGPATYHPGIDVLHYDLTLDLPDTGRTIGGRAVLTARRTAPVDTLRLDLIELRVDSVLVNGTPVRARRDSARIHIPLPRAAGATGRAGDTVRVAVRYGGVPSDGLIIRDSLGRWTAFGDNWPNRARHWIPSVDHPSDKALVTWSVRAPSGRRVVANGDIVEVTPLDSVGMAGRTLTRWEMSRPIATYLMVIGAAPLALYDLGPTACGLAEMPGCVRQEVYVYPEARDFLPGPFAQAGPIVEFFSRLVAPYPYERLAHLQSSTRYGGMENATAIFYSDRAFQRRSLDVGLVAHETAHMWFGNAVTQRDWAHLWLSEGFATYWTQLWTEQSRGDSAFRAGMAGIRRQITGNQVVAQRPVIDTAQPELNALLNANSYQKGGFVLHMLRSQLGDSAFFRGVRSYYLKHRHANALSDDLRTDLEAASGRELGWFFDQWLRRPGFAELTTSWSYDAARRRVIVDVRQGTRFAPYRFPLTVEVRAAGGGVERATIEVPATAQTRLELPLEVAARPERVVFDPDVELLATFTQP